MTGGADFPRPPGPSPTRPSRSPHPSAPLPELGPRRFPVSTAPPPAALVVGFAGLLVVAVPAGGGKGAWLSILAAAAAVEGFPRIAWTPRFVVALAFLAVVGTALTFWAWFTETLPSPLAPLAA